MNPPKIKSAEAISQDYIRVVFDNLEVKKFNINLVTSRPSYELLKDFSFLKNVKVDPSGYSVFWNDSVDLCEYELWSHGETSS